MKVIDLLNKIANGEEAPKKIKYKKMVFEFKDGRADYVEIDDEQYFLDWVALTIDGLNDEVEIIEEEQKETQEHKIEKLYHCCMNSNNMETGVLIDNINDLVDKINEIIDYINKEQQ